AGTGSARGRPRPDLVYSSSPAPRPHRWAGGPALAAPPARPPARPRFPAHYAGQALAGRRRAGRGRAVCPRAAAPSPLAELPVRAPALLDRAAERPGARGERPIGPRKTGPCRLVLPAVLETVPA